MGVYAYTRRAQTKTFTSVVDGHYYNQITVGRIQFIGKLWYGYQSESGYSKSMRRTQMNAERYFEKHPEKMADFVIYGDDFKDIEGEQVYRVNGEHVCFEEDSFLMYYGTIKNGIVEAETDVPVDLTV